MSHRLASYLEIRLLRKGVYAVLIVSSFRLNLLRAMYLYMFVGLAVFKWPGILNPPPGLSNAGSDATVNPETQVVARPNRV